MPLISIITPAFNAERFLRKTVQSVLSQSYSDWEMLIVVDDNSGDGTHLLASESAAADRRIQMLAKGTRGVTSNRNLGLDRAAGQYICFLDSDDWWAPDKLSLQVGFMQKTNSDISCTSFYCMNEQGSHIQHKINVPEFITYKDMLSRNLIGCLTVMIDRTNVGDIRFHERGHEDYALWLQLLRSGATARGLNLPLAYYRRVRTSLSSKKIRTIKWRWSILRHQEKFSLARSVYYAAIGSLHAGTRGLIRGDDTLS